MVGAGGLGGGLDRHAPRTPRRQPRCPCPAPRAREIIEPINEFHRECRRRGVPVIHVKTVLRATGVDDTGGYPSAWRLTFPVTVGPIPNAASHGVEGTRGTELMTEVKA